MGQYGRVDSRYTDVAKTAAARFARLVTDIDAIEPTGIFRPKGKPGGRESATFYFRAKKATDTSAWWKVDHILVCRDIVDRVEGAASWWWLWVRPPGTPDHIPLGIEVRAKPSRKRVFAVSKKRKQQGRVSAPRHAEWAADEKDRMVATLGVAMAKENKEIPFGGQEGLAAMIRRATQAIFAGRKRSPPPVHITGSAVRQYWAQVRAKEKQGRVDAAATHERQRQWRWEQEMNIRLRRRDPFPPTTRNKGEELTEDRKREHLTALFQGTVPTLPKHLKPVFSSIKGSKMVQDLGKRCTPQEVWDATKKLKEVAVGADEVTAAEIKVVILHQPTGSASKAIASWDLGCLFFADDILLAAETERDLQAAVRSLLDVIREESGMEASTGVDGKSVIMRVPQGGGSRLSVDGSGNTGDGDKGWLKAVDTATYLGYEATVAGGDSPDLNKVLAAARRAMLKHRRRLRGNQSGKERLAVFFQCVLPH
eukprot:g5703.t1